MEMTKAKLKELARKDGLYSTPYLNDKLFLHYKGFREIANLDEYTGLKVLWLEGNGLGAITGLEHQRELTTLYLHENVIETIEGLEACVNLDTLNLSKNMIRAVTGVSHLSKLKVLQLSHNNLATAADIAEIGALTALTTLDLSDNRLEDASAVLELAASLPHLAVLYLHGNPAVKALPHYRRTLVARCKALTYLDDRPVFPEERERCEAWFAAFHKGACA
jgi:dynein assembly factor 1